MSKLRVIGLNVKVCTVKLSDGQELPITNLFCCGIEFDRPYYDEDFHDANSIVCGPDKKGRFIAFQFSMDDFRQVPVN